MLIDLIKEKYTRGVSAVESILTLDRLRQSVAIKELEQSHGGQTLSMRKTVSVPNISQVCIIIVWLNCEMQRRAAYHLSILPKTTAFKNHLSLLIWFNITNICFRFIFNSFGVCAIFLLHFFFKLLF